MGAGTNEHPGVDAAAPVPERTREDAGAGDSSGTAGPGNPGGATADSGRTAADSGRTTADSGRTAADSGRTTADSGRTAADSGDTADAAGGDKAAGPGSGSRRPPAVTLDTARPEGGGRAAPGDAPAPARQWPLLTVLGATGVGLLIVGTDAFADAFRVGAIVIGVALLTGAVLRRVLPSVGMLAVRSRFTDMITYGVLGGAIVLLALVAQPEPWLDIPILEDAVHFTIR
ncbi:DUF3017 domain-containing protein [Streptomyces sp. NPDC005805]|uniref:DUF3017 domain-containing protein n=1 Tax=Streptomyces sp. NPDC005805 TaxID=3157068 RepID=UPI0033C17FF9